MLKRQKVGSIEAYNDAFLEMNRDSQILSSKESPKPEPLTTVIYDKLPCKLLWSFNYNVLEAYNYLLGDCKVFDK